MEDELELEPLENVPEVDTSAPPSASAKQRRAYRSQAKRMMEDLRGQIAKGAPGTEINEDTMKQFLSRLITDSQSGKKKLPPVILSQYMKMLGTLNGWDKSAKGSKADREKREELAEQKLPIPADMQEVLDRYQCRLQDLRVNLEPTANRMSIPLELVEWYCRDRDPGWRALKNDWFIRAKKAMDEWFRANPGATCEQVSAAYDRTGKEAGYPDWDEYERQKEGAKQ